MRVAVILPARIQGWGGVQRFGDCVSRALTDICETSTYRLHPDTGRNRARALGEGVVRLYAGHRRHHFQAVVTTFHWPPRLLPVPMLGFIHDLRHLGDPDPAARLAWFQRAVLRTWDVVLVPSEHVAQDVLTLSPGSRVAVVGEGADHLDRFTKPPGERSSLVVLGGRPPHKRAELGLAVAEEVVDRMPVRAVVLGPTPRPPRDHRIEVVTAPTDRQLALAHRGARVVLAPSRYEGFGLAAAEALRLGAPVVYASDGTLSSLVGSGGVPALPTAKSMADAIIGIWPDAGRLGRLGALEMGDRTWKVTARKIVAQAYDVGNRRSARKPRLPILRETGQNGGTAG